jgi:hypothetical protein
VETKTPEMWMKEKVYGYWLSQALYCAAELNLADIIFRDGPQTTGDLAKKTNTDERSLFRLLRYLASEEVFAEDETGSFVLTPKANQLRSDISGSQHAMAVMSGSEHYLASSRMIDNVRTGKCAYEIAHGKPIFEYLKDHPASARVFDKAMESIHGSESNQILAAYDFSNFITLADIGGGNGSMLVAILKQYPNLHGVLFDLTHVVAATASSATNVDRFKLVPGDFFESVTPNADAYLLRHIIHDWDDDKSMLILKNIRKALPEHGKVLMIEAILPEGNTPHPGKMFDWIMMGIPGGIERTLTEYKILFAKSGLHIQQVIPTTGLNSIIEATPL